MKLFSPQKTSSPKAKTKAASTASGTASGPAKKLANKPVKKEMSAAEIKDKLAAHVDTSDAAKNMAIKNSKKLGEGFLSGEVKPITNSTTNPESPVPPSVELEAKTDPNPEGFVLKSDIANNDPKDTNTQEKLKAVISRGAFNFNPREREALEKILSN
jgi:hypothetical protein